jgi:hypothetical protein
MRLRLKAMQNTADSALLICVNVPEVGCENYLNYYQTPSLVLKPYFKTDYIVYSLHQATENTL